MCNKTYKYHQDSLFPLIKISLITMPKIPPRDKLLTAVDEARRAYRNKRPLLEDLTDDKDLGEVIQKNLDRSYKQRYNLYIQQLHWIGNTIKHYKDKDLDNTEIRRFLGITRKQYYLALEVAKAVQEPEAIPYLEEIAPKDFDLSEKDLDYVKYGAWPEIIDVNKEEQVQKGREDKMKSVLKDLLDL
jgi:hypothetical protein